MPTVGSKVSKEYCRWRNTRLKVKRAEKVELMGGKRWMCGGAKYLVDPENG